MDALELQGAADFGAITRRLTACHTSTPEIGLVTSRGRRDCASLPKGHGELNIGLPRVLVALPSESLDITVGHQWDLTENGECFLFRAPAEEQAAPSITVVLNWRTELQPK